VNGESTGPIVLTYDANDTYGSYSAPGAIDTVTAKCLEHKPEDAR